MEAFDFAAFSLVGELDLNRLAGSLGIAGRFKWEEPLPLDPRKLTLAAATAADGPLVYLYAFGSVVFVNCDAGTVKEFSRRLARESDLFRDFPGTRFREAYALRVVAGGTPAVTDAFAVTPRPERSYLDIIASVIAKSVALERIEEKLDSLLDEVEETLTLLGKGKLNIPVKELARVAAKILNHKYRSIAYVMVLDKPEITWEDPEADRLYQALADQFEISPRYQGIKHKTETLMDITEVCANLSQASRAARLEWIIIVLIFIEIVIYLVQILS